MFWELLSYYLFCDQRAVRDRGPKLLQPNPIIPSSLVQLDSLSTSVYNWSWSAVLSSNKINDVLQDMVKIQLF